MGIFLYLIATVFWIVLTPINWVMVTIKYGIRNEYFKQTAIDIDKFGNRNFRTFLNASMRIKDGYAFGNVNETISSALGKNQRDNTLSWFGFWIADCLDGLDKEHCKRSITEI